MNRDMPDDAGPPLVSGHPPNAPAPRPALHRIAPCRTTPSRPPRARRPGPARPPRDRARGRHGSRGDDRIRGAHHRGPRARGRPGRGRWRLRRRVAPRDRRGHLAADARPQSHERLRRDEGRGTAHGPRPLRARRPRRLARGRAAGGRLHRLHGVEGDEAAYTVSKAGVITLVQALAHEMRGHGVTVNAVLPSTMDTPANRAAMPDSDRRGWVPVEAVADAIALLAREESAYITGTLLAI